MEGVVKCVQKDLENGRERERRAVGWKFYE
jgi:hypothetical protein